MSDIQSVLGKLRSEVAECLVLSNVASDPEKRQLFARVAEHISGLASAVQSELVTEPAKAMYVRLNFIRPPNPNRAATVGQRSRRTPVSILQAGWKRIRQILVTPPAGVHV